MKLSKTTTCVLVVVAAFVAVSCLPSAAAFPKPLAAVAADLMDKMGVDPPETQWFTQPVRRQPGGVWMAGCWLGGCQRFRSVDEGEGLE